MSAYSIPDLLELLRTNRGDRVLWEAGFPPTLVIRGELYQIEGPEVVGESIDEMLRSIISSRDMRIFRESGSVDTIILLDGSRFHVRAVKAFSQFRVELQRIAL